MGVINGSAQQFAAPKLADLALQAVHKIIILNKQTKSENKQCNIIKQLELPLSIKHDLILCSHHKKHAKLFKAGDLCYRTIANKVFVMNDPWIILNIDSNYILAKRLLNGYNFSYHRRPFENKWFAKYVPEDLKLGKIHVELQKYLKPKLCTTYSSQ